MSRGTVPALTRRATKIPAFVLAFALTGCATRSQLSRPEIDVPVAWKEPATAVDDIVLPPDWWEIFNDELLNALEVQAVTSNQDLQLAVARVGEARALARLSGADRRPHLAGNDGYAWGRQSENRTGVPPGQTDNYDDYHTGLDLSYEVDLWGRVRNANRADQIDAASVTADLQAVLLSVTADVARHYHELRARDAEIAVIQSTIALRLDAVHLQEARQRSGLTNDIDVTRARTELANVEAELHATRRGRSQLEHALAVLCGQTPSEFSIPVALWDRAVPAIPAGMPSSLLQRRPDILAADYAMQAADARIAVAHADFFPRISLTGSAGLASSDLDNFLKSGSRTWSVGPSVYLPLFDGGANRANLEASEARHEQSVAKFTGTVLNAFREVEDALSDLDALARQSDALNRASLSAHETVALANERYTQGLTSYLDVVDAQRVALQAERAEIQVRSERVLATIQLAKAVGGGWSDL